MYVGKGDKWEDKGKELNCHHDRKQNQALLHRLSLATFLNVVILWFLTRE